jgi:hypothetical protein
MDVHVADAGSATVVESVTTAEHTVTRERR